MIHSIAIRLDELSENTLKIFSQLLVDEKFDRYIITKEIGKITKKVHYHAFAGIETNVTYKSFTNGFRSRLKALFTEAHASQYCIQVCKDETKYLRYMVKDLDVRKSHGFEEQELKELIKETTRINREKTTPMKTQLVEHVFNQEELMDYRDIMKLINKYHVDRDYLPPSPTQLYQYTCYCLLKLNLDTSELYTAKLNI